MNPVQVVGKPRIGLLQFPGSNCDMDCVDVMQRHFDLKVQKVWHQETNLPDVNAIIIPGGFSYGDYLRSGALASHSPIISSVKDFVSRGGAVLGICNGFQVLVESHLLPGALLKNDSQKFVCKFVNLKTVPGRSTYQQTLSGNLLKIPVAHGEGRYFVDGDGLKSLQDNGQIIFRYVDENGNATKEANPNGSVDNIAGICSANGRVMGMMPHPERATDTILGGSRDGLGIFEAFLASFM